MAMTAGDKLGPYEIVAPIGAGGMGEVYKARDTRLDRTVAIKVLPEHIAGREDLRQRFEREARAVASLNHPNICTLHDIGSESGAGYMVMEYLEGETLAARIEKGAIPLEQPLKFALAAGVEIRKDGIRAGKSEPIFRLFNSSYAVSRDGKPFLVSEPEGDRKADLPMVVVLNWAAKLPK